jgi:hypothetical protein
VAPWHTVAVITATSTQTRIIRTQPERQSFYRVLLAQ